MIHVDILVYVLYMNSKYSITVIFCRQGRNSIEKDPIRAEHGGLASHTIQQ